MENQITKSAKLISKKQKIVVVCSIAGAMLIFVLFLTAGSKDKKSDDLSKIITNSKNRIILEDSAKGVKAEDLWRTQSQDTIESMNKFMADANKNDTELDDRLSSIEQNNQELEDQRQIIEHQASELEEIKSKLKELQSSRNLAFAGQGANSGGNGVG